MTTLPFVTLVCPHCDTECDRLSDGLCPTCFYVLTGGDQGTEIPSWQAYLAVSLGETE